MTALFVRIGQVKKPGEVGKKRQWEEDAEQKLTGGVGKKIKWEVEKGQKLTEETGKKRKLEAEEGQRLTGEAGKKIKWEEEKCQKLTEERGKKRRLEEDEGQKLTGEAGKKKKVTVEEVQKYNGPSSSKVAVSATKYIASIPCCKLAMDRVLGAGEYGTVYKAYLTLDHGRVGTVALKAMLSPNVDPMQEAKTLQALAGVGGVPKLSGVTQTRPVALVMEFCPGHSLFTFLTRNSIPMCFKAFLAVCEAITEIHKKGYEHRDLHLNNVMVDLDKSGKITVHIIDVGMAVPIAPGDRCLKDTAMVYLVELDIMQHLDDSPPYVSFIRNMALMKISGMITIQNIRLEVFKVL